MKLTEKTNMNMNPDLVSETEESVNFAIDKNKLRTIMAQYKDNRETLARYLDISESTLSYKMNERKTYTFNLAEIRKMIVRYHMTNEQVMEVFFNH